MARRDSMIVLERELYQRIALISGYKKDVVRDVITAFSEFVIDEIKNDIPVVIGQIGSIAVKEAKTYGGYNFKTGKHGTPHVYRKLKFTPSCALKRAISGDDETKM